MPEFWDAFISYGRADSKAFAAKLHDRLASAGFKIWFDLNDIPLGVDYQNEIDSGIEGADNFLFIIAPHSVNSIYCRKEIELALRRNKRIIPILHVEQISQETWQQRNPGQDLEAWEAYKAKGLHSSFPNMHPEIGKINWVYFREGIDDFDTALSGLLAIFERQKDYVHQHTLLLDRAIAWERNHKKSTYLLGGEDRKQAEDWLKIRFEDEQPPCLPTDLHCEFICESLKNANNLMTDVFLSYSDKEHVIMKKIARSLMREGLTVWTNLTDIKTGADFQQVINQGIEEANTLVFLLSPNSLQSVYCQQELDYARQLNKRIIPLLIMPMDVQAIPPELRALQFIDMTDHDSPPEFQKDTANLIRTLQEDAAYYEQHKQLLVKALKWERQKGNRCILLRGYNLRQAEAWLKIAQTHPTYPTTALQTEFINTSLQQPVELTLDVFIAYAKSDSDFVRKLNDGLQVQGKTTWFDQESIASGDDFEEEFYRGVERCHNFLYIISSQSLQSQSCQNSLRHALKLNKRIVTVMHQDVAPEDLDPAIAQVQPVDFRKHNGDFFVNFGDLIRTLDANPDYVRNHTRLLVRAMEWEANHKDDSYLLRGQELAASEQWLRQSKGQDPKPTELQLQYLTASRELPRRRISRRKVGLATVVATALVAASRWMGLLQPVELWGYDRLLTLRPSEPQDQRLLVVGVDEASLSLLPKRYQPSWGSLPDQALVDLLDVLKRSQASFIGIDFIRDFAATPTLEQRLRSMSNLKMICKITGSEDLGDQEGIAPPPEVPIERVGFANLLNDPGHFKLLRRHVLLLAPDEKGCTTMESLSLLIAREYLTERGQPYQSPLDDQGEVTKTLKLGSAAVVALDGDGSGYRDRDDQLTGYQTLLNFRAHQGRLDRLAPVVSLKDVLENRIPPEQIRDRIVLVGFTASTSTQADYWETAYGRVPGVFLHAQGISQLLSAALDGRPLMRWWPLWGETLWIWGWAVVGGVLVWGVYQLKRLAMSGVGTVVVLTGVCYLGLITGLWIPWVPPAIALLSSGGIVGFLTYRLRNP